MFKAADYEHDTANELEVLVLLLPEKSRQFAQLQAKAATNKPRNFAS
jgi:hypothetical protein